MTTQSLNAGLVAVGDIMLGDSATCVGFGFHSRHGDDAEGALAEITSLLRSGEVVIGNLECLLTRRGSGSSRYRADQMRGDPRYAEALRAAGFTALGVANNHAMQHGLNAFHETVAHLRAAGIDCIGLRGVDGWCAAPVVQTTRSGLRCGLLGYSWRPRQYDLSTPPYAEGDLSSVVGDVRRLARITDTVIVSLHWGEEFVSMPSVDEVSAARAIIDAGAAVVIGHHPHVVRPVEHYAHGIICYSLGNLVTDMLWQPELRSGAMLQCQLGSAQISAAQVVRTHVEESYRVVVEGVFPAQAPEEIVALTEAGYRRAIALSIRRQRMAGYLYAARHATRYPPSVLAELVISTLRHKFAALVFHVTRYRKRTAASQR